MNPTKKENTSQAKAIELLNPERLEWLSLRIIDMFGAEWRGIIEDYREEFGEVPNAADLLYILGEHLNEDPRKVIERQINQD